MRRKTLRPVFFALVAAIGVVSQMSCGENAPPAGPGAGSAGDNRLTADQGPQRPVLPGSSASSAQPASLRGQAYAGGGAANKSQAEQVASDAPVPPPDAQWTLLAFTDRSATHVQNINQLKHDLILKTGRRDWYAIHGRDESNLYFGFYRAVQDPTDAASSAAAERDKQMVRGLELVEVRDGWRQNAQPFKDAGFFPLSAPDPAAPPEWNLFNKDLAKRPKDPTRAFWSLQIMAFKSHPLRKEAAVQAVRALRKDGVEAYYYHGETISSVCVGAWPMDAIEQQAHDGDHTAANPENTLLVLPGELPKGLKPIERDDRGNKVVAVAPVVKVRDPGLKAMMERFDWNAVNYELQGVWDKDHKHFHQYPSFPVVIPRAKGNGFYDSNDWGATDLAAGGAGRGDAAGGPGAAGEEGGHTTWFGNHARGAAGTAGLAGTPDTSGSGYGRTPGAPGTYGAQLPPPPSEAPGTGHLRRVGE